jgi:type IV pilus assembly protein PilO
MATDIRELTNTIGAQFRGLNGVHPGQWPLAPRVMCGDWRGAGHAGAGPLRCTGAASSRSRKRAAAKEKQLRDEYQHEDRAGGQS